MDMPEQEQPAVERAGTPTIFYFSGTGNSLVVARDLAAALGGARLVRITGESTGRETGQHSGTVGFVFPVYFAGLPHIVRGFAATVHIEPGTYVFAVATFGGMAGLSFDQLATVLSGRGISLAAAFGIRMPGNYQVMYQPATTAVQAELFSRERDLVPGIAAKIATRERVPRKPAGPLSHLFLGYFYGRLRPSERDRNFVATPDCTGCGTCVRVCPAGNITLEEERPRWHHRCEYCLACLQWCPARAVQYGNKTQKRGRYHHPDVTAGDLAGRSGGRD